MHSQPHSEEVRPHTVLNARKLRSNSEASLFTWLISGISIHARYAVRSSQYAQSVSSVNRANVNNKTEIIRVMKTNLIIGNKFRQD